MSKINDTEGAWLRENGLIYSLMHDSYRRGAERLRNRFSFRVDFDRTVPEGEREAMLAMLQAAPEMLKALESLLEDMDAAIEFVEAKTFTVLLKTRGTVSEARAALTKARGE